ncbi:MAG: tryptophan synthase subunit alpha [Synergistaceae bacterium]|jgi:tryptophan synthase alpha chain|nr:tryptophan synthase subunit alpha [Synergistaceae bacterium]
MNRLGKAFEDHKALITFVTAGDPDLDVTRAICPVLEESGADVIELGIPFSDPQADGPSIQAAGQRALKAGTTPASVLELAESLKKTVTVPLVLMGYFNPILQYGEESFARDAARAGVAGVIVPDLPYDEGENFYAALEREGVEGILMVAPNSPESRLKEAGRRARGFAYCVSLLGTTGTFDDLYADLESYLRRVRGYFSIPVALGFGIDGPQRAARAAAHADGVVVGSALVRLIEKYGRDEKRLTAEVRQFVGGLKEAIRAQSPQG